MSVGRMLHEVEASTLLQLYPEASLKALQSPASLHDSSAITYGM